MEKNVKSKLEELRNRAKQVKANPNLRHVPNKHDIAKCSENTKLMQPLQERTITM